MQHYHQYIESIFKYVNALEYGQKRSKRAGNLITEDTFLLIAKNAILLTERFS